MPIAAFVGNNGREDPLAKVLQPPSDESEQEKRIRMQKEVEAKRVSDAIDEELREEERASKKGMAVVKVLLLGQSESGKSTTLKNFQLMNSPKAFRTERASWRAVIQLNVIRSIRQILELLTEVQTSQSTLVPTSPPNRRPGSANPASAMASSSSSSSSHSSPFASTSQAQLPRLTPEHLKLKLRLFPLLQVEEVLIKKLTPPGSSEWEATHLPHFSNVGPLERGKEKEVAVNSQFAWKGVFSRLVSNGRESFESADFVNWDDPEDPGRVIYACSEDMMKLWRDPVVQRILQINNLRLQDSPGFFLDSLERITSPRYVPTDDDILRARLKTLGVTEYKFTIREEQHLGLGGLTREWRVYDVGGHRSLRAAWAPYFDDVNVILFLAPISAFDQVLEEDPTINRLEDSVMLWKSIVTNPLLARTNLVLFLNKIDILKRKLEAGIRFADHIVSYGDRPNDYDNTSLYLRRKFGQIHKENLGKNKDRAFYAHCTEVTNPQSTQLILADLQESIVRKNLVQVHLVV